MRYAMYATVAVAAASWAWAVGWYAAEVTARLDASRPLPGGSVATCSQQVTDDVFARMHGIKSPE